MVTESADIAATRAAGPPPSAEDLFERLGQVQQALERQLGGTPPGRPPVADTTPEGDNDDMEHRLTVLETLIPSLATKADVGEVRVDIQKGINETHKWMIGTVIGLFVGFGGLFLAMSNALKPPPPQPQATQQQPIIINVPGAAPQAPQTAKPAKP